MALIIMAIGLAAIGGSIASAMRITNMSKERSKALAFARLEMEKVQLEGFNSAALSTNGTGRFEFSEANYYGFYQVTPGRDDSNATSPDIKDVYMCVYWDDVNNWQNTTSAKSRVFLRGTITQVLH